MRTLTRPRAPWSALLILFGLTLLSLAPLYDIAALATNGAPL
jgi:hypothetical protein